ncbi:MAG: glycosyl transferase [Paludibacteraceae bacterium]|nr:glycosyl transferase [Paludibacteraceae bacterium]
MIKQIHYCWFGGKPLPTDAQRCIDTWRKHMPDYKVVQWDESNYPVDKIPYVREAYEAKKYAFVSDYARFDILYQHGGIYLDTDVEMLRSLEPIIENGAYMGFESPGFVATGLGIAAPPQHPLYREILDDYEHSHFLVDGRQDLTTVVIRVTGILKRHGLVEKDQIQQVGGVTIYPARYFCPLSVADGVLRITEDTYTIHHYNSSWQSPWRKYGRKLLLRIGGTRLKNRIKRLVGIKFDQW